MTADDLECPLHGAARLVVAPTLRDFVEQPDEDDGDPCVFCEVVAAREPYRCPYHLMPDWEAVDWEDCEICRWLLRHQALVAFPGWSCELADHLRCRGCGACMCAVPVCRLCETCDRCVPPDGAACETTRWSHARLSEVTVWHHERFDPATGRWP